MKKSKNFVAVVLSFVLVLVVGLFAAGCDDSDEDKDKVLATKITISDSSLSMKIGEEKTLTANINLTATDRTVDWESSDATVVTVTDAGLVKAIAAGEATVSAKTVDGSNLKADCAVTVTAQATEKLSVDQTNKPAAPDPTVSAGKLTFFTDNTYKVDAFYAGLPAQMLFEGTYSVDNGILTFPGEIDVTVFGVAGKAKTKAEVSGDTVLITVETINAEPNAAKFTLSKENAAALGVTVGEHIDTVAVTGITCSASNGITLEIGRTVDVAQYFMVAPDNATDKTVTYAITEGNDKAGISNSTVDGKSVGTVKVTATTKDGNKTAVLTITVEELGPRTRPAAFATDKVVTAQIGFAGVLMGILPCEFTFKTDGTYDYTVDQTALGGSKQTISGFYTYEANGDSATIKILAYTNMEKDSTYQDKAIETLTLTKIEGKWTFKYQDMIDFAEKAEA